MQTRCRIVYTLVLVVLSACSAFEPPLRHERLEMDAFVVPDSAVAGSVVEVGAMVSFGMCNDNVRLEPRVEGDTVVVIALGQRNPGVCALGLSIGYRTLHLTAQPSPTMIIRFMSYGDSSVVRHVTVTPE